MGRRFRQRRRRRCLNAVSESRKRRELSQRNVDIQTARSKSNDDGQAQTTWTSQRCSAMICAHLIGSLSSLPLTSVTFSANRWLLSLRHPRTERMTGAKIVVYFYRLPPETLSRSVLRLSCCPRDPTLVDFTVGDARSARPPPDCHFRLQLSLLCYNFRAVSLKL